MPTLSLTYWSAIVVAGALTLYFGGRQVGAARSVARLRDMSATGAFGYSLLVVSVYQGLDLEIWLPDELTEGRVAFPHGFLFT